MYFEVLYLVLRINFLLVGAELYRERRRCKFLHPPTSQGTRLLSSSQFFSW